MTLLITNFRKYAIGSRPTSLISVNASETNDMVLGTRHNTRKCIDINQDINKLNDSESTSSKDAEKVKLNIKFDGVSLTLV